MRLIPCLLVFLAAMALLAGVVQAARSPASVAVPARPTYAKDVRPIFEGRCITCHRTGGIAPFSLTSYRNAYLNRRAISNAVQKRIMPPWPAERGHRSYRYDRSLTNAQIAVIRRWVAQGGQRGNLAQTGRPLRPIDSPRVRADRSLVTPQFTPRLTAARHDDHRCLILPWSPQTPTFITGFQMRPGVAAEVHHIILFSALRESSSTLAAWDAKDAGPGYDCFGAPTPSDEPGIPVNTLATWVPGSGGQRMPVGTGMPLLPGMRLIAQFHYHSHLARPKPDRTTIDLELATTVDRIGLMVGAEDPAWTLQKAFRLPRGQKDVRHAYTESLRPLFEYYFQPGTTHAHMAASHMHLLGKRTSIRLERSSGRVETLLSIRRWNFNWQLSYWFAKAVPLAVDDRLTIECHHDNSAANQPFVNGVRGAPIDVTWGPRSEDEMCVGAIYVSGKLKVPVSARLLRAFAGYG